MGSRKLLYTFFLVLLILPGCIILNPGYYKSKQIALVDMSRPFDEVIFVDVPAGQNGLIFVVKDELCDRVPSTVFVISVVDGSQVIADAKLDLAHLTFPKVGNERVCIPGGFYLGEKSRRPLSFEVDEYKKLSFAIKASGGGRGMVKIWLAVDGRYNREKAFSWD